MSEPQYFLLIKDKEEQQRMLEEAYRSGLVSEDEYMFMMQEAPEGFSQRDITRMMEIMRRIGILGRLDY